MRRQPARTKLIANYTTCKIENTIDESCMHLDALGGATPVDGAESALPKLVAVVEVVGRLQELLEAVDLPWVLDAPVLRRPRPRRIRS